MTSEVTVGPFDYRGVASDAGYEWAKGITDGKPRLIPSVVPGLGHRRYFLEQGVFLAFAQLGSTRADIKAFADRYGDIFDRYQIEQGALRADGTHGHGSTLDGWRKEVADMRTLAELWQKVQRHDVEGLKSVIKWEDNAVSYEVNTPRRRRWVILAHVEMPHMPLSQFTRLEVLKPARYALQHEVNARIADIPSVPHIEFTPEGRQRIYCTPPNLLGALWLQFAQTIVGEFDLYACDGCGTFFHRGPGGRRADATTCSGACRQRKNRPVTTNV